MSGSGTTVRAAPENYSRMQIMTHGTANKDDDVLTFECGQRCDRIHRSTFQK